MAGYYLQETVLKTAPTAKPVDWGTTVKDHLRLPRDYIDEDIILERITDAAIDHVEQYLGRKLITQTWYAYYDDWPNCDHIILPFGNLQSVTAIKYTDTAGSESTWSSSEYHVETESQKGKVVVAYGYTWPNEALKTSKPIEIEFVCGYGAASTSVPGPIIQAILLTVSDFYENREPFVVGMNYMPLQTVENLLASYRLDVIV